MKLWTDLFEKVRQMVGRAKSWARGLLGKARGWAKSLASKGRSWARGVIGKAKGLSGRARNWAKGLLEKGRDWAKGLLGKAKGLWGKARNWAKGKLGGLLGKGKAWAKGMLGKAKGLWGKGRAWAKGLLGKANKLPGALAVVAGLALIASIFLILFPDGLPGPVDDGGSESTQESEALTQPVLPPAEDTATPTVSFSDGASSGGDGNDEPPPSDTPSPVPGGSGAAGGDGASNPGAGGDTPTNEICADSGGVQWQGEVCVCAGFIDLVTICNDGSKLDNVTDQQCSPDPAACQDGGGDQGGGGGGPVCGPKPCGNGKCEAACGENPNSCPADCP